jgi:hypothetical protein
MANRSLNFAEAGSQTRIEEALSSGHAIGAQYTKAWATFGQFHPLIFIFSDYASSRKTGIN